MKRKTNYKQVRNIFSQFNNWTRNFDYDLGNFFRYWEL